MPDTHYLTALHLRFGIALHDPGDAQLAAPRHGLSLEAPDVERGAGVELLSSPPWLGNKVTHGGLAVCPS